MPNMLDVTKHDIAALDDADLRALVARLVEATLRCHDIPTAAVTSGGDQDAPDGGLDVRVELTSNEGRATRGFLPRAVTGFQVKKPKMGPAAILKEMRPGGELRPSIAELVERSGAYIIVSSGSDLPDSGRERALSAMRSALADHPLAHNLKVDFYDRQRLATWVRDFPVLVPWVLEKAGRPIQGWRSFGAWTATSTRGSVEFLVDETARLYYGTINSTIINAGLPVLVGMERLRGLLARSGASVRLVGLSGVGKTRLVEALFDDRIGVSPLDPGRVIYTDLSLTPEPAPIAVATFLSRHGSDSIIVVDNCPPDLHRQLTEVCRRPGSSVGVLTIEYDIRDDSPEGTDVFRLEAASIDLVARVVGANCPWVSGVDLMTIGVFSGGNARIGLALAHTLKSGENLSGLSDEDLFVRLFQQRHSEDSGLLTAAETCALIYSFDGETVDDGKSELLNLAALAGCPVALLFRQIEELFQRGLLQKRGRWRAVLPHAIANRLAKRGLENIHEAEVQKYITHSSERLLRSFSRRLSFLHDSPSSVRIVRAWLSESGLLGACLDNLQPLGIAVLVNIAPVAPDAVLAAIEGVARNASSNAFFTETNRNRRQFVQLLRKICFDAKLFKRCALLLAQFALYEIAAGKSQGNPALDLWPSMFAPRLSGTHAPLSDRLEIIETLLRAANPDMQKLGLKAFETALETVHFSPAQDFSFGSLSRDYGYEPKTESENIAWYMAGIATARKLGTCVESVAADVREVFARQIPGLCTLTPLWDSIEDTIRLFAADRFWIDGWVAVKEALWRFGDPSTSDRWARLASLEEALGPKTLEDNINVFVLRDRFWILEAGRDPDGIARAMSQGDDRAEELGRRLSIDVEVLDRLLSKIMAAGNGRRWYLGRGMAAATNNRERLWLKLTSTLIKSEEGENICALSGYLSKWKELDPVAANLVLEDAAGNPALMQWLPQFEAAVGLSDSSVSRLLHALEAGTSVWAFSILRFGRLTDTLSIPDLAKLLSAIASAPEGWRVAAEILAMRLSSDRGNHPDVSGLFEFGRGLLRKTLPIGKAHKALYHDLAILTSRCLAGPDGAVTASLLCESIAGALRNYELSCYDIHDVVVALFRVQPKVALEEFLRQVPDLPRGYPTALGMFEEVTQFRQHPISVVPDDAILEWCAQNPAKNFVAAASSIPYCKASDEGAGIVWTELAQRLLERAPDPSEVLRAFVRRFIPRSWQGSRAEIIEVHSNLLVAWERSTDVDLAVIAGRARQDLLLAAHEERQLERTRSFYEDERFE